MEENYREIYTLFPPTYYLSTEILKHRHCTGLVNYTLSQVFFYENAQLYFTLLRFSSYAYVG